MTKAQLFAGCMVWLAAACGGDDACAECEAPDAGPDGRVGDEPGDGNSVCESLAEDIAWDAESDLGSPADLFGAAEGSCQAELSWDGSTYDADAISPGSGRTGVTVELALDHDSARWYPPVERGGGRGPCGGFLEVQGAVSLQTETGTFEAESEAVTLRRYAESPALTYRFDQAVADHEGSLSVELEDGESGSLTFEIDGSGAACAGEIRLNVSFVGNGFGSVSSGRLAQWSDNGCPLGQDPVDLTEPNADGLVLKDAIEERWGERSFTGRWLDGQETALSLQVAVTGDMACASRDELAEISVPVRVTYSTADGRLRERTAEASVRVAAGEGGEQLQLQLWLSDEQACADEGDTLDYTPADCTAFEGVTVQLGINASATGGTHQFTDEGLNVYFEPRGGSEPPSADRLQL